MWLLFLIVIFSGGTGCSIGTDKSEPLPEKSLGQLSNIEGSSFKINGTTSSKELIVGSENNKSGHPQVNSKGFISRKIVVAGVGAGDVEAVPIACQIIICRIKKLPYCRAIVLRS